MSNDAEFLNNLNSISVFSVSRPPRGKDHFIPDGLKVYGINERADKVAAA
jgi:hypothetical protein